MCAARELRSRAGGANGRRRQRSKQNLTPLTNHSMADSFSSKSSRKKLHQTMSSSDASPDSKCPICLDRFENVSYLDHCWHRFCFRCVQEWSKNKAECPLCKQPFHSIVHSMRSENDYKVYTVKPAETDAFANPDGRRFRYRTTVTRERRTSAYPRRNPNTRRTASPPDNGILFEGLSGQSTGQRDAEINQMIRRLQSRRQANLEGRSMRQIQEQEIINFRRALYRSGTRVRSIEDGGRYRDISAEFFRRNPACLHRLVPWLKRELTVLFGAHGSLVNIVQHIIMSNVTRYDLESTAFTDELKPFLLHRTEHFLHEFINFARCPFNIEAYDQHANYDCPAPSYEEGSRSESSIITISPDEADSQEAERNSFTVGTDQAPWDDETPGPSYSSSDQVCATLSTTLDTSESSDEEPSTNAAVLPAQVPPSVERNEDSCDSLENCVIVGYVKPLAERTPELVELSSDSEESVVDGGKCEEVQKKVKPIQYQSFSDTDASGYASPFSLGSRDGSASRKVKVSSSSKKQNHKRSEHDKSKASSSTCLQNPSREREDNYDDSYAFTKKRKSEVYAPQLDREHRGFKSKNKDRSLEKRKKKRDSSRHKHKKDKKKSKTRDKSLSRKSKVLSLSNESIYSRELSRSRSRSNDCNKNSRRQDSDDYFRGQYHSKYDRNASRDYYELSYSRRNQYSRHSPSPDYGVRSFYERTNNQISRGRSRSYYYGRDRSRSRSSSQSRTPSRGSDRTRSEKPSGKRKYKTRHLESMPRGSEEAASASSKKESSVFENLVPKHREPYKRSAGLLNSQPEADIPRKKEKKTSRSPSVEIIYEGTATDITRRQKRKRKWERKPHANQVGYSPVSSPVVITIDSDSDKASEIQDNTECDSIISWSPLDPFPPNEKEIESPSLLLEARDDKADEAENVEKEHRVTPKRDDVVDETLSGIEPLNGVEELQNSDGRHAPSAADNSKASSEQSNGETESFCCLPTHKASLLLHLSKHLHEQSCELDTSEQNL